ETREVRRSASGAISQILVALQKQRNAPRRVHDPKPQKLVEEFKDLVAVLVETLNDADSEVRENASNALRQLGADSIPGLITVLAGKAKLARVAAATLLGEMGGDAKEALPALIRVMKEKKADKEIRRSVSAAICQILAEVSPPRPIGAPLPGNTTTREHY